MERFEQTALDSYSGISPSHWFRYVDDTLVKIKKSELDPFFDHINSVDSNIKFTQEGADNNQLPFLDCLVKIQSDGTLTTSVYRKATHTDQYLQFDSHHPLIHKLGVIKTLFHRAETIPPTAEAKAGKREHLKSALGTCGYKDWTFQKALKPQKDQTSSKQSSTTASSTRKFGITIPYVSDVSEKLKRIFGQHQIPVSLKPCNTLRQKLVHPKDKIPQRKQSNIVYAINCQDSDCDNFYIGETKQPLHKRMYQHRRPSSTWLNDSAVYTHLKAAKHNFEDKDVIVLDIKNIGGMKEG
ncbi:uncharacterized protein [Amphiura filiformis]|uniref:uncharacterized protein n=1 Tax=Amphiura filiformis TaxID=82378 RepID=UPI003B21B7C9